MAPIPVFTPPAAVRQKPAKAKNRRVNKDYLTYRTSCAVGAGYAKPKWIEFCEFALNAGLEISLYEAKRTASKYITLKDGHRSFKVRFSNHKPIAAREARRDCDFFVGVTNQTITTTSQAIAAVQAFLGAST